jgi:hypothetical protein
VALAATSWPAVGHTLPALRVFAVTFVGLVGALAVAVVARSGGLRPPSSGPAVASAGLLGVGASIAVAGYWLVEHPMAAAYLSPAVAVFLAVVLAGCLWLTLFPPGGLTTSRAARGVGVGGALALGVGLLVASRLGLRGVGTLEGGVYNYLLLAPVAVVGAGSVMVAAVGRSFRAGVQAAVWTTLLSSLAVYAVGLAEAIRWYQLKSSLIFAGDGVPLWAAGENLRGFAWGLVLLPFWWLPFGVIGAAIGGARGPRRWVRRTRDLAPRPNGSDLAL